jgi:hypothetical protein
MPIQSQCEGLSRRTHLRSARLWDGVRAPLKSRRRAGAGECVGAAQRVGYPEPARHAADHFCRVGAGHPGGSDKQRARRHSPQHRDGVGTRGERRLGHADHRDAELGVCMSAQAGPATRGPDRRTRRPPAAPARRCLPEPRAAAAVPAGRTPPAGIAALRAPPRCARPPPGKRDYRRPPRLPPGHHQSSGNARPRPRTGRERGARRRPHHDDAQNRRPEEAKSRLARGMLPRAAARSAAGHPQTPSRGH